jgi:hypothetical protein
MSDPEHIPEVPREQPAVEQEVDPAFIEAYVAALPDLDEIIEMTGNVYPANPSNLGMEDDRDFGQLSVGELEAIRAQLCARYGVDLDAPESLHRTYTTEAPEEAGVPGTITVDVFSSATEHFLHRLTYADGTVSYLVGPDVDFDAAS